MAVVLLALPGYAVWLLFCLLCQAMRYGCCFACFARLCGMAVVLLALPGYAVWLLFCLLCQALIGRSVSEYDTFLSIS